MAVRQNARPRLSAASVGLLPPAVRRPGYDRAALRPGHLHLGAGAFHRCHQAEWTDDALEAEFGDWGIIDVNLRPPELNLMLGEQDGLFCRELRDRGVMERRLVGSVLKTHSVLDAEYDPNRLSLERALAAAADPAIRLISMTVTEKGYCHVPATGELDENHPDIVHDIARPDQPRSVPGFVLRVLQVRRAAGTALPVLMSCDNVPDNGATLRRCVIGLARHVDPALADALEREARFLNTMVDRIVPATREIDVTRFAEETGVLDLSLVVGEPFRMWVIEDSSGVALPPWHRVGVMIVDDVAPFELMKMRVLNGIQTNVSALGLIDGLVFMSEVMGRELFRDFARQTMQREVLPGLPPVPGIDLPAYVEKSIGRLENPEIRHSTAQIVTDGSQKIRQRLLEPIRACRRLGIESTGLEVGLAAWMQTATGRDLSGAVHDAVDPLHGRTKAIGEKAGGDARALVRGLLALEGVFGTDLGAIEDQLVGHIEALRARGVAAVMRETLGA